MRSAFGLALLSAAWLSPAFCQTQSNQPDQRQSSQIDQTADNPAAPFVTGRVLMDNGTPAIGADIEVTCSQIRYIAARTDGGGGFSFQLGQTSKGVLQDASVGQQDGGIEHNVNTFSLPGDPSSRRILRERFSSICQMRASLPGYASDSFNLARSGPSGDSSVGDVILHWTGKSRGVSVSVAELELPRNARNALEKGREAMRKNNLDGAIKNFRKAAQIAPKSAVAWNELGKSQIQKGESDSALQSAEAAIKADPRCTEAYLTLAAVHVMRKDWEQVAEATSQAIQLNSRDYPQAYMINAVANFNRSRLDLAESSARTLVKMDSDHRFPAAIELLSVMLAGRGKLAEAAGEMREYLRVAPDAKDAAAARARLAGYEQVLGAAPGEGGTQQVQ